MATESLVDDPVDRGIALLMRKLAARDEVGADEERVLRASVSEIRTFAAGRVIVPAGETRYDSNLLIDGFAGRYRDLADGQRQIMELHVPGDFMDLHSFLLKQLEHNVGAMTPVTIAIFPHEAIKRITESHAHLARLLWFSTLLDAAIHRETILTVGRRTAIAGVAHLLCELYVRLEVVGLAGDHSYRLPLTQSDLADATGLTSVHVNRMLKELRDDGVLTFRGAVVTIHDWPRLQRIAEFDPRYLHVDRQPR